MWKRNSLVALLAVSAMAQGPVRAPQAAAGTSSISGRIVDARTGVPVKRALVTVEGQTQNERSGRTMTGDDGSFLVKQLPKGRYWITAEKTGFLRRGYRARSSSGSGDPVELGDGEAKTGIDISLAQQGLITGRVFDEAGEAAERVLVQAIPVRTPSAGSGPMLTSQTNDLGEFRLARVPPGSYRVLANRPASRGQMLVERAPGQPPMAEAPTYFPGTVDPSSAGVIQVNAGQERPGVEIQLQRSTVVSVSGQVTGERPTGRGARVAIRSNSEVSGFRGGLIPGGSGDGAIGADGSFVFRNVRPGEYTLTVISADRGGPKTLGKQVVAVGQEDVTNVTVTAAPAPTVDGHVRADGEPPFSFGTVELSLRVTGAGREYTRPASVKTDAAGNFSFAAVSREKQVLTVKTPAGVIVKAVYASGQLLPGMEIDFATVTGPLDIVLSNQPGTIAGIVEGTSPDAPRVAVWAVPDAQPLVVESWNTTKLRIPSNAPVFVMDLLRAGVYRVAAVADVESDALSDAAVWEQVKAQTATVTVREGGNASIMLKLIPAQDLEGK